MNTTRRGFLGALALLAAAPKVALGAFKRSDPPADIGCHYYPWSYTYKWVGGQDGKKTLFRRDQCSCGVELQRIVAGYLGPSEFSSYSSFEGLPIEVHERANKELKARVHSCPRKSFMTKSTKWPNRLLA